MSKTVLDIFRKNEIQISFRKHPKLFCLNLSNLLPLCLNSILEGQTLVLKTPISWRKWSIDIIHLKGIQIQIGKLCILLCPAFQIKPVYTLLGCGNLKLWSPSCPTFHPQKYHNKYKWWKIIDGAWNRVQNHLFNVKLKWQLIYNYTTVWNEWKTTCSKQILIFSTSLYIYRFLTFIPTIASPPPSPQKERGP